MTEPGSSFLLYSRDTPPLGLGDVWGAFLIGTTIGVFLNVFTLILGYKYFQLYPTDTRFLRCVVLIVLPLDLFQTVVNVNACYWHLVTNHSNPSAIFEEGWSFIAFGPASVWTIVGCQIFYAHRVFRFSSYYRWLALLATIGMGISLAFDITLLVKSVEAPNLFALAPITWLATGIYGSILSTDVILTCTLVFVLARKRTGRRLTDTVITSLIAYSVSSGLLFTIISGISFLFTIIQRGNLIFCAFTAFGVKVYVMSMMTAIILRKTFATRMRTDDPVSVATTDAKKRRNGRCRSQVGPSVSGVSNIVFAPAASTSQGGMDATTAITTTGEGSSWDTNDSTDRTAASD